MDSKYSIDFHNLYNWLGDDKYSEVVYIMGRVKKEEERRWYGGMCLRCRQYKIVNGFGMCVECIGG